MDYYNHYKLSPNFGFLPHKDPLKKFRTKEMFPLEEIAKNFKENIKAVRFKQEISNLKEINVEILEDNDELELAHLYYSVFAHGYIWETGTSRGYLPENLVKPWLKICKKLNRLPILTYNSIVMHNWQRIDINKGINLDNISTLIQFNDLIDESWFFLLSVELELIGLPIVNLGVELIENNYQIKDSRRPSFLNILAETTDKITKCLIRMYEQCNPEKFYTYLRPFLTSFTDVEFRGAEENIIRSYHGGSAAQSSLIQLIDAILKIDHKGSHPGKYLKKMRDYMPVEHRYFLEEIEKKSPVSNWLADDKVVTAYNNCIEKTTAFRQAHLEMVAKYIVGQKAKVGPGQTGTGGTNPMIFLKSLKKDTSDKRR